MEDFGYQKDGTQSEFSQLAKRAFLVCATLFSIACFVYVTINAYYFVYQDKNSDIETIKSPEGPIKVVEEELNSNVGDGVQIDRSIYEDIFGNKKSAAARQANPKIRNAPEPALPPKQVEIDRRLIKESATTATKTPATKEQKIIVYSDDKKKEIPSKDLLTKTNGEERAAPAKAAAPQATQNKKRAVRVQVAAMTSKNSAEEQWKKLNHLHSSLFSGLKAYIEEVNLGKRGIFFRLQIGNFYNQIEAEEFCNRYVAQAQKSKADCIVVE